jgi:hypothetical protein
MSLAHAARMRIVSLLTVSVAVSAMSLAACGGATAGDGSGTGPGAGTATGPGPGSDPKPVTDPEPGDDPPVVHPPTTNGNPPGSVGTTCAMPTAVSVGAGGVIARPVGSALRLQLTYQGTEIGVNEARGVDMILPPADGPFTPGKIAGYWVEAHSGGATTYQHLFEDPTKLEAVGAGGSGFTNLPVDRCTPKLILADLPNDPSTTELVIYGSPYGTNDGAVELGHFTIK